MNCPGCHPERFTTEGEEGFALCDECRGEWAAGRGPRALFDGNLVVLPFAFLDDEQGDGAHMAA